MPSDAQRCRSAAWVLQRSAGLHPAPGPWSGAAPSQPPRRPGRQVVSCARFQLPARSDLRSQRSERGPLVKICASQPARKLCRSFRPAAAPFPRSAARVGAANSSVQYDQVRPVERVVGWSRGPACVPSAGSALAAIFGPLLPCSRAPCSLLPPNDCRNRSALGRGGPAVLSSYGFLITASSRLPSSSSLCSAVVASYE